MERADYDKPMEPKFVEDYTRWFLNLGGEWGDFHNSPGARMYWRGQQIMKTPSDLWVYQEILTDLRPSLIVEFGTYVGGTTLFLADVLGLLGVAGARIVSFDIAFQRSRPIHPSVEYHVASSLSDVAQEIVSERVLRRSPGPVLLIEDSLHEYAHVLAELSMYCHYVTPGSYFIVEDTYAGIGRWTDETWLASPARAVMDFLNSHPEFTADYSKEKFGLTTCHGGFLRRAS